MRHVVSLSGGLGSWAAGKRVAERHGTDNLFLVFCDTLIEDEDLYRALPEMAADIGGQFIRIADGRTPWQVFADEGMIGNTRADLCSRILKRDLFDRWLRENCNPADTVVHLGIDWTEDHRFDGARARYASNGWECRALLCEKPLVWKPDLQDEMRSAGIEPPRMYGMGFPHNNCGGFCIKGGHGQFAKLLMHFPDRYAAHEAEEAAFRARTGKNVSVMRDRSGGVTKPLTMRAFRERVQDGAQIDLFDLGGCGCFLG